MESARVMSPALKPLDGNRNKERDRPVIMSLRRGAHKSCGGVQVESARVMSPALRPLDGNRN